MAKGFKVLTGLELTEVWRPHPDFIGPSMPPMIAWQRRGSPEDDWQRRARERATRIADNLFAWAQIGDAA